MNRTLHLSLLVPAVLCISPLHYGFAQGYPIRPIRLVVPYSPGGASDNVARPLAQEFTERLAVPVIVDNRSGGGTMIGANVVAKAPPDGYTILLCSIATQATSPQLYSRAPYDPLNDFEAITQLVDASTILVARNELGFASVADLVNFAKANSGKLTYASSGTGSPPHLSMELFLSMAGLTMVHVPYKGSESLIDIVAGRIDLQFTSVPTSLPYVRPGRMKGLAITGESRWPDLPNVPTFAESGWPQYQSSIWQGLCAPAKTPKAIIDRLNKVALAALASPSYRERLRSLAISPIGSSPQEFASLIRNDYEKYGKLIKVLGVRVD